MQHGGHAHDRGGFAQVGAHGVLRIVGVAQHARKRAVVADGAGQHVGHALLLQRVHDAARHLLLLDEPADGAVQPHAVDGVQVVVVAERAVLLRLDVLAERRVEVRALQIVRGQRVSGEHRVDVARLDDLGERRAREAVERERRPHHPHDVAVFALVLQQLVELVVLAGERRLARAPQAEGEVVGVAPCVGQLAFAVRRGVEPGRVDVDALLSRLGAPAHDGISRADVAELAHEDASVLADGNAVHAAVFREQPCAVDLEVLGVDAHRVVAFWRHAVFRRRQQHGVGRAGQRLAVEVGSGVGVQCEAHGLPSLQGRLRTSGYFRSHAIIHGDEAKASEDSPASRASRAGESTAAWPACRWPRCTSAPAPSRPSR